MSLRCQTCRNDIGTLYYISNHISGDNEYDVLITPISYGLI